MIKKVSLEKVDEKIRYFFKKLRIEKNQYILEIGGKPIIGVVPPWQVIEIKQRKNELFSMLKEVWSKTEEIPGKRIEKVVQEGIRAARRRV